MFIKQQVCIKWTSNLGVQKWTSVKDVGDSEQLTQRFTTIQIDDIKTGGVADKKSTGVQAKPLTVDRRCESLR